MLLYCIRAYLNVVLIHTEIQEKQREAGRACAPGSIPSLLLPLSTHKTQLPSPQHHTPALLELDARRGPSAAERRASCADSRTRACWLAPALVEDDNAGQAQLVAELVGERLLVS